MVGAVCGYCGNGVPNGAKLRALAVAGGKQVVEPEIVVADAAMVPVFQCKLAPSLDDVVIRGGGEEPTRQQAFAARSGEREKPIRQPFVKPFVERPQTIAGAVDPNAAVSGEQGDTHAVAQGFRRQIFIRHKRQQPIAVENMENFLENMSSPNFPTGIVLPPCLHAGFDDRRHQAPALQPKGPDDLGERRTIRRAYREVLIPSESGSGAVGAPGRPEGSPRKGCEFFVNANPTPPRPQ